MKYVVGAALAFSVCSNIWLWINLWNLKNELFGFEGRMISYLKELSNGYVGEVKVTLDGKEIAQATRDMYEAMTRGKQRQNGSYTEEPIHTMTQAFQQAMRDSSEEAPLKQQQSNE